LGAVFDRNCHLWQQDKFTKLRRPETQPLLTPQGRREGGGESSQQADSDPFSPENQSIKNAELSAKRVVKYTIWFLMFAVLLGTVLGTVLVSMPLQKSVHAPGTSPPPPPQYFVSPRMWG